MDFVLSGGHFIFLVIAVQEVMNFSPKVFLNLIMN